MTSDFDICEVDLDMQMSLLNAAPCARTIQTYFSQTEQINSNNNFSATFQQFYNKNEIKQLTDQYQNNMQHIKIRHQTNVISNAL